MKKHLLTLAGLLAAMAQFSATAHTLSPDEALATVCSRQAKTQAINIASGLTLQYTAQSQQLNAPALYVFAKPNTEGFIIVAADNQASNMLLGYSENTQFDPNNIPPSMQWWLNACSATVAKQVLEANSDTKNCIANNLINTSLRKVQSRSESERQPIQPLMETKWDQGTPYNLMCPKFGTRRAVTGCVATAMAQIMKVHQWPVQGVGSHSYSYRYNNHTYSAEADFGATTYDWDNMLNNYSIGWPSQAQKDAVATLMFHCGVASDMSYDPDGSGAQTINAAKGMIEYFNYDQALRFLQAEWFTSDQWIEIIYNQLEQGLPVLYTGVDNENSGHAFVCDGYSQNDYFHINWGWGGLSDGYFLLSDLDPESQGTGGGSGSSGFVNYVEALIDIRTPVEGSEMVKQMAMGDDPMTTDKLTYNRSAFSYVRFDGGFYNYSLGSISLRMGVHIVGDEVDEYIGTTDSYTSMPPYYGYQSFSIRTNRFPVGEYKVYPAFQTSDNEWHEVYYNVLSYPDALSFTVTSSDITVSNPNEKGEISSVLASIVPVNGTDQGFYAGNKYDFVYDVTTTGPWSGELYTILITSNNQLLTYSDGITVNYTQATQTQETLRVALPNNTPAGDYTAYLTYLGNDDYFHFISEPYTVSVVAPEATGAATANISFAGTDNAGLSATDPAVLKSTNLLISSQLTCTEAPYYDALYYSITDAATGAEVYKSQASVVRISEVGGQAATSCKGPWSGVEPNQLYAVNLVSIYNGAVTDTRYFTITEEGKATVTNFEFVGSENKGTNTLRPATLSADDPTIKVTLHCDVAPWSDAVSLGFLELNTSYIFATSATQEVNFTEAGQEVTLTFTGPWDDVLTNKKYRVVLWGDANQQISSIYYFSIKERSAQTITWNQDLNEVDEDAVITLNATASSGLAVTYEIVRGSDIASVSGNTLTVNGVGEFEIKASQEGNSDYYAAEPVSKVVRAIAGISAVSTDNAYLKVEGKRISVINLPANEAIEIYNTAGALLYKGTRHSATMPSGTYIVAYRGISTKVIVK